MFYFLMFHLSDGTITTNCDNEHATLAEAETALINSLAVYRDPTEDHEVIAISIRKMLAHDTIELKRVTV